MYQSVFLTFVCMLAVSSAAQNVFNFQISEEKQLLNLLKSQLFEALQEEVGPQENAPVNSLKVGDFSWKDCGAPDSIVSIKSLSLSPDPIALPGAMFVSAAFSLKSALHAPLKAHIELKKKIVGIYIRIPCVEGFGSCDYDDLCQLLSTVGSQCPGPVKKIGIDCKCPIKPKSYVLPKSEFDINASLIPPGEYHIVASVTQNGKPAACLDLYVTFE